MDMMRECEPAPKRLDAAAAAFRRSGRRGPSHDRKVARAASFNRPRADRRCKTKKGISREPPPHPIAFANKPSPNNRQISLEYRLDSYGAELALGRCDIRSIKRSLTMNQQAKRRSTVVTIARASFATRGAWGNYRDEILMQDRPGLTCD
jgi:hypothetical protein